MTPDELYRNSFYSRPEIQAKALEHALDIRKFEIGLYWQRATYFWALIAATFAGYFAVLAAEGMHDKHFNAYVLACIGNVFSLAWFLSNRGSKFWQENWELHVDMLEDKVVGPLYKTVLQKANKNILVRAIEGPASFSVSKINQWVSLFTLLIWLPLIQNVVPELVICGNPSKKHVLVAVLTLLIMVLMVWRTRSTITADAVPIISTERATKIQ